MKKIIGILLVVLLLFVGCEKESEIITQKIETDYNQEEKFIVMNFELVISKDVKIIKYNNKNSIINGKEVVKVPIEVKNIGNEKAKLSMFYYKFYNIKSEEISSQGSLFDDSLDYAEELNPNESYTKYLYFLNSNYNFYYVEFNDTSKKIKVGIDL